MMQRATGATGAYANIGRAMVAGFPMGVAHQAVAGWRDAILTPPPRFRDAWVGAGREAETRASCTCADATRLSATWQGPPSARATEGSSAESGCSHWSLCGRCAAGERGQQRARPPTECVPVLHPSPPWSRGDVIFSTHGPRGQTSCAVRRMARGDGQGGLSFPPGIERGPSALGEGSACSRPQVSRETPQAHPDRLLTIGGGAVWSPTSATTHESAGDARHQRAAKTPPRGRASHCPRRCEPKRSREPGGCARPRTPVHSPRPGSTRDP